MFTDNDNVITPAEETQEPEMLSGVVVDCVRLNVRTAPNPTAAVVCTIPCGAEVVVFEEESTDEFYKVYTASGAEGFCMKQYVSINS